MASITRQQLTDAIDPVDLMQRDCETSARFQRTFAWLFLAISQNDVISITPALKAQMGVMFRDFPQTRDNIKALLGE